MRTNTTMKICSVGASLKLVFLLAVLWKHSKSKEQRRELGHGDEQPARSVQAAPPLTLPVPEAFGTSQQVTSPPLHTKRFRTTEM